MSIGMTYDEFWFQDVDLVRVYRKADDLRRRRQSEALWLQGVYVRDALLCTVGNMFSGKSATKHEYPREPYPVTQEQIEEREEREARNRQEKIRAEFAAFAARMQKKMPDEAHPGTKGGDMNVHNN
jgi:hypothetical protein